MNNIFVVEIYDDQDQLVVTTCINNEKLQELHQGGICAAKCKLCYVGTNIAQREVVSNIQ